MRILRRVIHEGKYPRLAADTAGIRSLVYYIGYEARYPRLYGATGMAPNVSSIW
jgi:hypothetical protein